MCVCRWSALAAVALALLPAALPAADFTVDPVHSSVGFAVKHMVVSTVRGQFTDFEGTFTLDDKGEKLLALSGQVKVPSVNTANEKRDDHLRSPDFFDAKTFPAIAFKLKSVEGTKATGTLTIRDVSKDIVLDVAVGGVVKGPDGKLRGGFSLNGTINRMDFNVKFSKALETGGLMVGEEVRIIVEVEGVAK